ncbi:hypothetical protein RJ639_027639 [Escallonia herrerae]|uniref:RRM domain-containing protein n=1 Tax=Escallonia herrerae TaxID=1293975 RepID=A0AA89BEN5_9ASTE|nr:hypothetical protein RJ639_027639 [Escallonia herrerae]
MQGSNGSDPAGQQQPAVTAAGAPPPQQWVAMQYPAAAMQYPAAAMVMQHQMMGGPHYAPHYMPYPPPPPPQHHVPHQQHLQQQQGSGGGENRTIWVGDLHNWMDEDYLRNCFASTGEVASIKVIRNKQTGFSEGYGFVEFFSHAAAEKVLQTYTCIAMPNTEQPFRLNWATFSMGDKRSNNGSDLSIFVGDLASDVTDTLLHETFASRYSSVKAAKVVIDANTGRSKGYGFVRFGDDNERTQAMTEMNGVYCSSRAMRIGVATPRKSSGYQQQYSSQECSICCYTEEAITSERIIAHNLSIMSKCFYQVDMSRMVPQFKIFVGGLDANVSDEDLKQSFSQYGEIVSVKIPVGKGCGSNAEEALQKLNGTTVGKQTLRTDFGNQWPGAYYGGQIYDGYGYAMPQPHDPSMYVAAAYGAYPMYGTHQQQFNTTYISPRRRKKGRNDLESNLTKAVK